MEVSFLYTFPSTAIERKIIMICYIYIYSLEHSRENPGKTNTRCYTKLFNIAKLCYRGSPLKFFFHHIFCACVINQKLSLMYFAWRKKKLIQSSYAMINIVRGNSSCRLLCHLVWIYCSQKIIIGIHQSPRQQPESTLLLDDIF